jgi:hypothetical protein
MEISIPNQNKLPVDTPKKKIGGYLFIFLALLIIGFGIFTFIEKGNLSLASIKSVLHIGSDNSMSDSDWQTYTNTKYHYSFRYPKSVKLFASNLEGITNPPIDQNADVAMISDNLFYVQAEGNIKLDPSSLQQLFKPGKPEDVMVEATTVNGLSGYKVKIPSDPIKITYYFIAESNDFSLKLSVLDNNDLAKGILDSFQLVSVSGCLPEGAAAENPSLGPNGHFGTCCSGLEPKVKPGEEDMDGQALYCTTIK